MDNAPLEGLSSLVQLSGFAVPARARFVGEALVSATLSSLTLGLSFGMVGASLFSAGPLVPFLVGSWTGYTFGLVNHWRTSIMQMTRFAQLYPTILAHALATERGISVPSDVIQATEAKLQRKKEDTTLDDDKTIEEISLEENFLDNSRKSMTLEDWIRQGGLGRITWSILAAQNCRNDIEELQRQQRQKLMEEHQEKFG